MADYISKQASVDAGYLSDWYIASVGDESPVWTDAHIDELLNDFIVIPNDTPTVDIQPVVETEDLATATEQFICKNCGIRIENFDKVVLEEDNDGYIEKLFYEYIFKFCVAGELVFLLVLYEVLHFI